MMLKKRILSLILMIVITVTQIAACKKASDSTTQNTQSINQQQIQGETNDASTESLAPDFLQDVAERKSKNADTVGWLRVGRTTIDDVVVMHKSDVFYYLRRNFEKQSSYNGVYFADPTSVFGDGTRQQLGTATTIYGHAMADSSKSDKYEIMFGPLHEIRSVENAKQMPYFTFSTDKENMVFEIFAAFIANSDNTKLPYHHNDSTPGQYYKMVVEEVLPRSIYNYDVQINPDDKFMTLSTCIYTLPDGTPTNYPNTYYRFALMGRLVEKDAPLKTQAVLTVNENLKIDPAGKMG